MVCGTGGDELRVETDRFDWLVVYVLEVLQRPAGRHVRDDMRTAPIAYEEDVPFAVYGVELKTAYFVTLRTQEETD